MNFVIENRNISLTEEQIIGDNKDYTANFTFDSEWDGKVKTARFINYMNNYVDALLENNSCIIPVEILKQGTIRVGVYCDKFTTTQCSFKVDASIKNDTAEPVPTNPDTYGQMLTILEKLKGGISGKRLSKKSDTDYDFEWADGGSVAWGGITGEIQNQHDLAMVLASYADEIDKKVTNNGNGVSGALYNLDYNSNAITDDTQIVVQESDTKWVRRKADMIWQWMRSKIFSAFVSLNPQELTKEQRVQARDNIKAAAGGKRRVTQDTSRIIDISSYTSSTKHFECPCDGYLRLRGGTSTKSNASVDNYTSITAEINNYNMTFVAEGAWIFVSGNPQVAQFLPIELVEGQ